MNPRPDSQLLLAYAERRSDAAFAELVRRHLNLVHAAALRITRDPDLAKDVSQAVFIALANQAEKLAGHSVLAGWLHRTTRNIAAQIIRTETRRRARERMADLMPATSNPDPGWQPIAPQLDAALSDLAAADRDAILLRYFENKSAQQMADLLGIAPEAAQKRVTRAVERLKEKLARRGVPTTAGSLAAAIAAYAAPAAPTGLAPLISASALSAAPAAAVSVSFSGIIAMTTLQKSLAVAALAGIAGWGVHEWNQRKPGPTATPDLSTEMALPGKSQDRAPDEHSARSTRDAKTSRSRLLESLDQKWLEIGGNNAKVPNQNALAAETVRLLGCGPELYQLVQTLEKRRHLYGAAKIGEELSRLFRSADAAAARQMFASIPEVSVPGKQFAKLEEWSKFAGKGCSGDAIDAFVATLKNEGCALEARFGRNETLMRSDPEAAVLSTLRALEAATQSRSRPECLKLLFWVKGPQGIDYAKLESLLPPEEPGAAAPEEDPSTFAYHRDPIRIGRQELYGAWAEIDPQAALNHLLEKSDTPDTGALQQVTSNFAASKPDLCLAWLKDLPPGPVYDTAAASAVVYISRTLPEVAKELTLGITDEKKRKDALEALAESEEYR